MSTARIDDRSAFARLLHRGLDVGAFFDAADRALAEVVPFDASCWLALDPATLLPTSHFTREVGSDHLMAVAANEFLDDDVNKFATLARASSPVGLLSEATGGAPARSKRFRTILAPHGYAEGDELRAVFREGDAAWGCVAIHRRHGLFTDGEARLVAEIGSRYLGEGIHRAVLLTALMTGEGSAQPGLIVARPDGTVESLTPAATRLLSEIVDSTGSSAGLPLVVASLVATVQRASLDADGGVATVRLPRRTGGWHLLYGSQLDGGSDGRVAVMVYPETTPEIPAVVAAAHALSAREREVTALVLQGCSTREIASRLHVSPYTVQDHLKKVFAKVGVHSRRELTAQLFSQHYAPRLGAEAPVNGDGWSGDSPETGVTTAP